MTVRASRIRTLFFGVVLGLVLTGFLLGRAPGVALGKRPNIVVIQTDDQSRLTFKGHFRGQNGARQLIMPRMVRGIVRSGAEFRNYYAANPVCSPSRGGLLTGQYAANSGLSRNGGPRGGWTGWQALPVWTANVPVTLRRAGYRTAHFGKFLNGYHGRGPQAVDRIVPPGWDRWFTIAFRSGTPYYGYHANDDGIAVGPFGSPNYRLGVRGTDPAACRVGTVRTADGRRCLYLTDLVTRRAVKEIRENGRNANRPFFLQVDYQAPHADPRPPHGPTPPTRYAGTASRTGIPRNPAYNEADMRDKPAIVRQAAFSDPFLRSARKRTMYYRRYVEALRGVDDGVGAILHTLRETGQLRNTYIFYLTDHGIFLGEHRFFDTKFLPYNASSRVGMAVRGPGIQPGTKVNEVVANIDIPATVLRLARTRAAYEVDGRPLKRFWRHPWKRTRRPVQISMIGQNELDRAATSGIKPSFAYHGYRVGPYKYIRYRNGERELYDLRNDPFELRNRAGKPRYSAVEHYMRSHLSEVRACAGASCRDQLPPWPEPGY